MPLDGTVATYAKPKSYSTPGTDTERWCTAEPTRLRLPRPNFEPVSDVEALRRIMNGIANKWARKFNGADGDHCVVGWTSNVCDPTTVVRFYEGQTQRILKRLHDALPPSAQRPTKRPESVLAFYNDTHSQGAMYRVAERAYFTLVDELQRKESP